MSTAPRPITRPTTEPTQPKPGTPPPSGPPAGPSRPPNRFIALVAEGILLALACVRATVYVALVALDIEPHVGTRRAP